MVMDRNNNSQLCAHVEVMKPLGCKDGSTSESFLTAHPEIVSEVDCLGVNIY